jgi:hypothetical protein
MHWQQQKMVKPDFSGTILESCRIQHTVFHSCDYKVKCILSATAFDLLSTTPPLAVLGSTPCAYFYPECICIETCTETNAVSFLCQMWFKTPSRSRMQKPHKKHKISRCSFYPNEWKWELRLHAT